MDDDIFSDLSVTHSKKTYIKKKKGVQKQSVSFNTKKNIEHVEEIEPLKTKVAVQYLLDGKLKTNVCRYCLHITPGLSELDQIIKVAGIGNLYKVTIRDIIASFHPFKVVEDPNFPNKICQKCLDRALSAYLFTQQCERAERAMLNCFDDIYEKFEKLDPIDRPKKRGRQKLKPNHNLLHAEHRNVIDYAEPIMNIINIGAERYTKEPKLNELECKKCFQVLPNLESLLNHEKIHPKTMWYHCRLCGKSFPKYSQIKRHNHRIHVLENEVKRTSEKDFACNECEHVTDNYVTHLQHVEKHKFKNVMKHLIEKQTNKLCAVCLNNGVNMTDLNAMVCIHGGHADLMGDKTLYSVLATTLPNQKLNKYQELFVPLKAQIMTISKKNDNGPHIKSVAHSNNNPFIFSNPIIISKIAFKSEYFYMFSDLKDSIYDNFDINEFDQPCMSTNEVDEDDEQRAKKAKLEICANKNTDEVIFEKGLSIQEQEIEYNPCQFIFSKPQIIFVENDTDYNKKSEVIKPKEFNYENLEYLKNNNISKTVTINNFNDEPRNIYEKASIYNIGDNSDMSNDTRKCKFCWVFQQTSKCEYCMKVVEKEVIVKYIEIEDKLNNSAVVDAIENAEIDRNMWQCHICLTINNTNREACHCCGNLRREGNEIKFAFGINRFSSANKTENISLKNDEKICIPNIASEKEPLKEVYFDVPSVVYKINDITNMESAINMDIETNSNTFLNNSEEMEVEEHTREPIIWNSSPVVNFETHEKIPMSVDTNIILPESVGPNIGGGPSAGLVNVWPNFGANLVENTLRVGTFTSNIQFNIGATENKPMRKFKRAIRNLPKAFHK